MSNLNEEEQEENESYSKLIANMSERHFRDSKKIDELQKELDKEKEKNKQKENKIKNKIKFYEGLKNLNKNESIYSVEELKYSEIVDLLKDLLKEN